VKPVPSSIEALRWRTKKDVIRRRIDELQSRGAQRAEVSVASLLGELEDARARADNLEQLSAAVRAIEAKAKISGITVDRIEIGGPGAFDECESSAAVITAMVEAFASDGVVFTEAQETELNERVNGLAEFLAACKARPAWVIEANSPADARDRERRARNGRSLPPPRL
jgi:hypothetical protein